MMSSFGGDENLIYLNVDYKNRFLAKKLGSWYNSGKKSWCTSSSNIHKDELLRIYGENKKEQNGKSEKNRKRKNRDEQYSLRTSFEQKPENGILYCLTNSCLPGLTKNGYTTRNVEDRLRELSNTSVPQPFVNEYFVKVSDVKNAEKLLHQLLEENGFRRQNKRREFFEGSPVDMYPTYLQVQERFPFSDGVVTPIDDVQLHSFGPPIKKMMSHDGDNSKSEKKESVTTTQDEGVEKDENQKGWMDTDIFTSFKYNIVGTAVDVTGNVIKSIGSFFGKTPPVK